MDGLPTINGKASMEEALRMIDESIEKQQKAIDDLRGPLLALKSRRNSLVPICRLPAEIFCRIFAFAQIPKRDSLGCKIDSLAWIYLTHVCRHWRNIAVNTPSLWTAPPMKNLKWVEVMLKRSKKAGLVIKSDGMELGLEVVLKRDIHRIRELLIKDLCSRECWDDLQCMLRKSAPQLERFCLTGAYFGMGEHLMIPDDVLCDTERLRDLKLGGCDFNWNSRPRLLSSLTRLTVHGLSKNSAEKFVDALKIMPELEVLDLYNCLPSRTNQHSSSGSDNIHLARLRSLQINSTFSEIASFFCRVTFPPTAMVQMVCRDSEDETPTPEQNFSGAILGIARSYSNTLSNFTGFQSLNLGRTSLNEHGIQLSFFTEALEETPYITCTAARLKLAFYCYSSLTASITRVMKAILNSSIPFLYDITTACIPDVIPYLKVQTIADTLGMLPSVRHIMAGAGAAKYLSDIHLGPLAGDAAGYGETSVQALYFPSVSSIYLEYVTFVGMHLLDSSHYRADWSTELLQDFLIQRCELGVPIETLTLRHCYGVSENAIKVLQEVVVHVDCDACYEDTQEGSEEEEEEDGSEEEESD